MEIKAHRTEEVIVTVKATNVIKSLQTEFFKAINISPDSTIVDGSWLVEESIHPSGNWTRDVAGRDATLIEQNIYKSLKQLEQDWRKIG
tara:strand:- start:42799 stop:43065 length:267 start_codon:yes stop_codon:yes gene_type:complete